MADVRSFTSLEGIDLGIVTYKIDNSTITYDITKIRGSAVVDRAVSFSADLTVQLTADGDFVVGKLVSVENDGYCAVQTDGYTTLPAGTTPNLALGKGIVGCLLAGVRGYIRSINTAVAAELAGPRVTQQAIADPTAVVVSFD